MTKSNENQELAMNFDDFEKRLQCQPVRQPPTEWRNEIIAAAQAAGAEFQCGKPETQQTAAVAELSGSTLPRRSRALGASSLPTLWQTFTALLWPAPGAWAGLVVIWFAILAVNHWSRGDTRAYARRPSRPASELLNAWAEQKQILVELIGPTKSPVADRPKLAAPRPRSERGTDWLMA